MTRSPIKARPLRNPGQYLGEEIKRLQNEDIGSYIMIGMVFAFLAAFEWIRVFLKWPPQPWLFTAMAVLICCFAVIKIKQIRGRVRILRQAEEGEKAVGQYLESFREKGYKVLHDIVAGKFNLDHVLIGPSGVYVIETKTISKPAKGQVVVEYDGEKVTVNGHTPDRDPVMQARALSRWLEELIRESTGKAFKVRPVVVYPGWYVSDQPKGVEVWVLNPKALPAFLEHEHSTMSPEDVHLVCYHLSRYVRGCSVE
jgi:Nuclease-related domain